MTALILKLIVGMLVGMIMRPIRRFVMSVGLLAIGYVVIQHYLSNG